jgi:hypothetical protein
MQKKRGEFGLKEGLSTKEIFLQEDVFLEPFPRKASLILFA